MKKKVKNENEKFPRALIRKKKSGWQKYVITACWIWNNAGASGVGLEGVFHWPVICWHRNSPKTGTRGDAKHPQLLQGEHDVCLCLIVCKGRKPLVSVAHHGSSDALVSSSAQEEKGCCVSFGFERHPHSGHREWQIASCVSVGVVSLGCSGWCFALVDYSSHSHGGGLVPLGS